MINKLDLLTKWNVKYDMCLFYFTSSRLPKDGERIEKIKKQDLFGTGEVLVRTCHKGHKATVKCEKKRLDCPDYFARAIAQLAKVQAQDVCPECGENTFAYDPHLKRRRCLRINCQGTGKRQDTLREILERKLY